MSVASRLNTRVDGPAGAPWIVLSNSLGANLSMWEPQVPLLARHYRVLRYDTRGHGLSPTADGRFELADLVADVVAIMDAYAIERADFLGLSLGGMTGLGLALAHPWRLNRLVVADARADAPEAYRQNWDARIARVEAGGLAAILPATLESWFTEPWRAANPAAIDAVAAMVLGNDPAGYIGCCHALKGLDYLRHLGGLRMPVLYLCGEADKGAPPEVMGAMATATPDARFEVIAGAAHVANMNAPDAFNAALASFLGLNRP